MAIQGNFKVYTAIGLILSLLMLGLDGIFLVIVCALLFLASFSYLFIKKGKDEAKLMEERFERLIKEFEFSPGIAQFLATRNRFDEKAAHKEVISMTGSAGMDRILEQMLQFVVRDYIDYWYKDLTNDELFRESLKRTSRRTIAAFSQCVRKVDWVPFFTRNCVDDFASHLRLYRMARERLQFNKEKGTSNANVDDLESHFFDFEFEMEKTLCRDLLSTTPHYENAYLHDLIDILLYLLMPPEDFRCRPLRFLVREIMVKIIFVPLLDHFSNPENINQLLVWLLSEVSPRPEDFVQSVEHSPKGRDAGGEHGDFVKQQLASLEFLESTIRRRLVVLSDQSIERGNDVRCSLIEDQSGDVLIQLPIHVVLTNSVAVSYFCDFLMTVGGQNYIDCYLAIEGFKVSVEHQLRSLALGETDNQDVYETVKEAAKFMYHQYLSQEAITRVPLKEAVISRFLNRMKTDEPSDSWFEQIQDEISEVLRANESFYPAFKRDPLYEKMLLELGIIGNDDDRPESQASDSSSVRSGEPNGSICEKIFEEIPISASDPFNAEPIISVVVETLGIGQQGKQSFALYNIRVERTLAGKKVSGWNVLRRYSDFHTLHNLLCQQYPKISTVSFPGKKTFNNLDTHFIEKRTQALNAYMEVVLSPNLLRINPGMDRLLFDFLSQKEYTGSSQPLTKKVMSAMWDPIGRGMRAVSTAVAAVPDQVVGGVTKVGDGIGKAAKAVIRTPSTGVLRMPPTLETDRVAAKISDEDTNENIPLRVMVLFVDEVFGVRAQNAWFRRQLVALLRGIVTPLGTSINKRIIDLVNWLTSDQQATLYLAAIRDSLWPDGQLAGEAPQRSEEFHERTRVLARSLMLSVLPDELRLILGQETTYQGIATISAALQRPHLNRRLLYVLIERLLISIFPNNRFEKIFAQLHSKSPRVRRA
ncbi:unnamed protein product, partial [Mesorhabditis belari]|uniref:Sorting nexin-13 n=1 Tax=Mesorhabditis belari TaxID=2138241 RepID=A0AAF3EQG7_9BILA